MTFKPEDHLRQLKGQNYLDCVWRVVWVREEHPDAQIETEVVFWDHDKQEIMVRARVLLPKTGARATAHCLCSAAEFKFGYTEKAETQAIGRALALLGYGTAFAGGDLEEGERGAESGVTMPGSPAKNGSGATAARPAASVSALASASGPTVRPSVTAQGTTTPPASAPPDAPEPRSAAEWTREQLGARIREACDLPLKSGQDWANLARLHGQPVPTSREAMTQDWLLALYQAVRASTYAAAIPAAAREEDVTDLVAEALGDVDRRHITMEQYHSLREAGEARKAELASPLLAGAPLEAAS